MTSGTQTMSRPNPPRPALTSRVAILLLATGACGVGGARTTEQVLARAWIEAPAGTVRMGAPANESCRRQDKEPYEARIDAPFTIAPYEVTQAEFEGVMGYNPSFASRCPTCPVDSVSWHEAAAYTVTRSVRDDLDPCYACTGGGEDVRCRSIPKCNGYRLPTETEWVYAARAGTRTGTYAGAITSCMGHDDVAEEIAWFKSNSVGESQPVGTKEPNPWGLYDIAGNVYEWTGDATNAVLKGGSWYHNAHHTRAASQLRPRADAHLSYAGFRIVRTLDSGR